MEYNHLKHMWIVYQRTVSSYARVMFEAKVKPFCESRGLKFVAKDEGCWVVPFEKGSWKYSEEDDDEWQEISTTLCKKVPGMDCRLCSLMSDFEVSWKQPRG